MSILGILAASLTIALLILLVKGGIRLVGAVIGAALSAVIQAIGLVLSGLILAIGWIVANTILFLKFIYRKITQRPTAADAESNDDWMQAAKTADE